MPIMVPVSELEEGMCLADNIVNNFSVLLSHGYVLKEKDILGLQRRIPNQMISIIDPILDKMVEFDNDKHDRTVSQKVRKNIAHIASHVGNQVRSGVSLSAEHVTGMQSVIDEMLKYLQENPVTMALIEKSGNWDNILQEHSANVFYLSIVIGNTIRNYIKQERERLSLASQVHNAMNLTPLATASIFHDIGMVPLESLYHKEGPLTEEEKQTVRMHPETGAEMLPDSIDPMVKLIIRTHHENQNGTGYPNALPGDKINIFARIVRIADAYSAAVADTPYHKGKTSACVLYEMTHGPYRHFYDPVVMKVFSTIVPPFPVGAKLKLKDGRWAVVVRQNHNNTFQPEVVIAYDQFGDPLPKDNIKDLFNIGERGDVEIATFSDEDVSFVNNIHEEPINSENIETLTEECSDIFQFDFP